MCNVQIERNALAQAATWCDRAELTLSQTSGMDDNDYRTLAALRGRLFLALGRSKEAVAQFDRAIAPGGAQPADDIAELYELRSRAHAAVGNYPAAFTDQGEYLRRMREQGTLDRIREVAQLRVQFENDQEKQKIVAAREGQEARRRTAQQPDAHDAARGHRRAHRSRDRVLPRATRCSRTGGIAPSSSGSPSATSSPACSIAAPSCARPSNTSRARAKAKGTLIIGLIDLDHFKSINDRFGHAVGDQLLQRFAAALRTALHTREIFGRYGGEEFLVLFPDSTWTRRASQRSGCVPRCAISACASTTRTSR